MNRYDMRMRDGRNHYGSRSYVDSRDYKRSDGYGRDSRDYADSEYDSRRYDRAYQGQDYERDGRDYESDGQYDMARNDYGDMRDYESDMRMDYRDGHYPMSRGSQYRPVEAMGYFTGYYGGGNQGRGRYDRQSDMRYEIGTDYGFDGHKNKKLSKQELQEWKHKLLKEMGEREKEFFNKETISSKARSFGIEMKDYDEEELAVATAMMYTDYFKTLKKYMGSNMDVYVELARDWLEDKDSKYKGSEKLSAYYYHVISGEK